MRIENICFNCKHSMLYQANNGREVAMEFLRCTNKMHCNKLGQSVNPYNSELCFEKSTWKSEK